MLSQYKRLGVNQWKNECPIVLVHGFAGSTSDESYLFQGYFHYAFMSEVIGKSNNLIFEADVSPFGSVHDRACELYQQLIGIQSLKEEAEHHSECSENEKHELNIADLVYGKEHVEHEHADNFYKPKYLKTQQKGKILAYPNGIPGGWCKHRKVHFVCHSLGSLTVRYLQYLLEIDYFQYGNCSCEHGDVNESLNNKTVKINRSDWIASITCLNPVLNGGPGTYFFGIDQEKQAFNKQNGVLTNYLPETFRYYSAFQNLTSQNSTMNREGDIIIKKFNKKSQEFYELGTQY